VLVATSAMGVVLVRLSPMEPLLAPVVPVVLAVTVHDAAGAPPDATVEVIVGVVPPMLAVTSAKLPFVRPLTGSLNVTVQVRDATLVGFVAARLIEVRVGRVVSYT
jgi:hypothetical protein